MYVHHVFHRNARFLTDPIEGPRGAKTDKGGRLRVHRDWKALERSMVAKGGWEVFDEVHHSSATHSALPHRARALSDVHC